MNKYFLPVAAACVYVGTGFSAQAQLVNVTGEVVADNFVMINLQQSTNNTVNVFDGSTNNDPFTTRPFNFTIDSGNLGSCQVQVVVWNEIQQLPGRPPRGESPAGWAGYFTGNIGSVYTGMNNIKALDTQGSATAGTPPIQTMESWISSTVNPTTILNGATMPVPLWGAPALNNHADKAQWIWSSTLIPTPGGTGDVIEDLHFRSFTFPCADIVDVPAPPPPPPTDAFRVGHFQCYDAELVEGSDEKVEVFVEDQFGKGEIVTGKPVLLCNPSSKVHREQFFEIKNTIDHLVCYEIVEQTPVEEVPIVRTRNQFAEQILRIGEKRSMFCLPSGKEHVN